MRSYGALLRLYPASFREEYGGEMCAIFARRWRQAPRAADRAMLVVEALVDAFRNAPAAHRDVLTQDTRTALQAIRRAPRLSITVVVITAVGIGATTAAFAVADHVLIRPLPYQDPDRLVKIWQAPAGGGRAEASPANFRDWRDNARSFERIAGFEFSSRNLVGIGEPVRLEGASVTGNLFVTLGIAPLLGRTISIDDDRDSAPPTVVLSERLWHGRFGGDPAVIGRAVTLDDQVHVIIGVMPAAFEFPSRLVDFWIPIVLRPQQYVYGNPFLHAVARLKPGVSRDQAQAEIQEIARAAARADAQANPTVSAMVTTLRDDITGQDRLLLWILVAAAASLLLIACTNLANLLLTRGLARQKELAVRIALGASRRRLVRALFTENALLAVAGGIAGVGIAAAGISMLARLVPTTLPASEAPAVDVRLLAAVIVVTAVSAIAVGLVPAGRISRRSDSRALHDGVRAGTSRSTSHLRSSLVVAQVAMSVLLLVSSGLLLRAMLKVQEIDPGFRPDGVLTLRTTLPPGKYDSVRVRHQFFSRVLDGIQALPGVTSSGYITGLPLVNRAGIWVMQVPGYEALPREERLASLRFVTPRFFEALGVPLRRGRDVANSDTQTSQPVAVVSESFASRYWPGQDGLGRQFRVRGTDWTIVGIVGDVRVRGLEQSSEPQIYLPEQQMPDRGLSVYVPRDLVVRSERPVNALLPAIRAIIASADPQQPISDVQLVADIVSAETAPRRVQVRVLGTFAAIAFLLAGIGLHGLLAYNVSQSRRDIAVRIAVGAERHTLLAMVMRRGMSLALVGVTVGTILAVGAGQMLQSLLAGISPTDIATFAAAVLLVIVVAVIGTLLPALRAMRVNPTEALAAE